MKSVSQTAAKPFKYAGEKAKNTAKKANPMRLFGKGKRKAEEEAAKDVTAELADVNSTIDPAPTLPTQNTATPGAQRTPGTFSNTGSRSTISLPSQPGLRPSQAAATPPPIAATSPDPIPAPITIDLPRLSDPPALPTSQPLATPEPLTSPEPLSTPPTLLDDGFIQLTPKLPAEEELLLPE
jgi:hypothetical protein